MAVTMRSVNHRFLDLQLRIPPTLAPARIPAPRAGAAHVGRGRVEVSVSVQQRRVPTLEVELNEAFLAALGGALDQARERGYITGVMTPGDLLRFPQALSIRETSRRAGRRGGNDCGPRRSTRSVRRSTELDEMRMQGRRIPAPGSGRPARAPRRAVRAGRRRRRGRARGAAGPAGAACPRASRRRARRRNAGRAGDCEVRRPLRHHRGGRPLSRASRALARALRLAGAVRPQARLPDPGDEP